MDPEQQYQAVLAQVDAAIASVRSYTSLTLWEMANWLQAKRDVIAGAHDKGYVDAPTCTAALQALLNLAVDKFGAGGDPKDSPAYKQAVAEGKDAALAVTGAGLTGAMPSILAGAVSAATSAIPWYVWAGVAVVGASALWFIYREATR